MRSLLYERSRKRDKRTYHKKFPGFLSELMNILEEIDDYLGEKIKEFEYHKKYKRR